MPRVHVSHCSGRAALRLCAAGVAALSVSCGGDRTSTPVAAVGLHLLVPKGLLDVDVVQLEVFDTDASKVTCKGSAREGKRASAKVTSLKLTRGGSADAPRECGDPKKWCGSLVLARDDRKTLTWYVEGTKGGGIATFRGCTQQPVNGNNVQVDLKVEPIIVGSACGDGLVSPPKTCDPGPGGASDEGCDKESCRTNEVVLSNGRADAFYFRGRSGRKTGVALRLIDDGRALAVWSDRATQGGGGDGLAQITFRRVSADFITEPTPESYQSEIRLQDATSFRAAGDKKRGGDCVGPSVIPAEDGNLLTIFSFTAPGTTSHIYASLQKPNFTGSAVKEDVALTGPDGTQDQPAAAGGAGGNALIVYVDGNAIKSILRKAGGSLGAVQTLSTTPIASSPRVAWVGGDYVVVWADGKDIRYRRVRPDGTFDSLVPEGIANEARRVAKQDQPDVAGFPTGEFIVTYRDFGGDSPTSGTDIRIQRFDSRGQPVGSEIGAVINDIWKDGDQVAPAVAAGTTGAGQKFYLVAWLDPARPQIGARYVNAGVDGGYLYNPVDGRKSEFAVGVQSGRARSWPAVVANAKWAAVGWVDESEGEPGADDDRVRVRRFPLPAQPR